MFTERLLKTVDTRRRVFGGVKNGSERRSFSCSRLRQGSFRAGPWTTNIVREKGETKKKKDRVLFFFRTPIRLGPCRHDLLPEIRRKSVSRLVCVDTASKPKLPAHLCLLFFHCRSKPPDGILIAGDHRKAHVLYYISYIYIPGIQYLGSISKCNAFCSLRVVRDETLGGRLDCRGSQKGARTCDYLIHIFRKPFEVPWIQFLFPALYGTKPSKGTLIGGGYKKANVLYTQVRRESSGVQLYVSSVGRGEPPPP